MVHSHTEAAPATVPDHGQLMRSASYASVGVSTFLLAAKLYAWWQTDSLAMLSSFTDSVFDVVMSIINMLALRYALKPADEDHRFGHTSIEDIVGLAQCAFIAAGMALIGLQAFERLGNPRPLTNEAIGIWVSAVALVASMGLVAFQTYVTRLTRSMIVTSDRLHYVGDILFNIGVLAAFGLSHWYGFTLADPIIALLITVVVLWNTRPIAIRAFNNLMDREMPSEEIEAIRAIIGGMDSIRGHHQLKTRYAGNKPFIQLHLEIDANLNFREAHAIADAAEQALAKAFPGAEVIVHADPRE